jgi:NTE family protein
VRSILVERIEAERIEYPASLAGPNTRFCIPRIAFISLLILVMFTRSFGQETASTPPRPKVGLVLEGGSALGLAHIGVIEWLEDHRVPVNYVAGTSMGALVGGLYATGHSSSEVKALIKTIDWDRVLAGQTPYKNLSFRRKEDRKS